MNNVYILVRHFKSVFYILNGEDNAIWASNSVSRLKLVVVVNCLPRPMEGMGDSNFQISLQNCQVHHRWTRMPYYFYRVSLFCVHFHF